MNIEKINNIIKSEKFILINYTTKIKNDFDFINFQIEKVYNQNIKNLYIY